MTDWQIQLSLISVGIVMSIGLLAWRGWRNRIRSQLSQVTEPPMAPSTFGQLLSKETGDYVATTFSDDFLNRISAYGLGIRGKADFELYDNGLLILRRGERPIFIDFGSQVAVERNQAVIDRAVERNGLLTILHGSNLATHIRLASPQAGEQFFNLIKKETAK